MAQKFTNAARSPLMASISAVDTSLTIDIALSDLFPVADTGTDPVPTIGKDWFKIVLQNNSGQIEIVYVRTRTLGSASMTNLLRGQDGTTARDYLAGSIVGLRHTALDLEGAVSFASGASAFWKTLVGWTTAALSRAALGATAVGDAVFTANDAAAARAAMGAVAAIDVFNGVKFKEEVVISEPSTLTAELHLGAQITIFGATPITLPIVSTFPVGTLILFVSRDNGASVLRQSPNVFLNEITTVFPMDAGDTLLLESNGGNNWFPIAGTALHKLLNRRNFGAYPSSIAPTTVGVNAATTFANIPSWVTRVKVMFLFAGNTHESDMRVQLGTSSGIKTTEYQSTSVGGLSPVTERKLTSGMVFGHLGGFARSGIMTLDLMDPNFNVWMQHHSAIYEGSGFQHSSGCGRVTLTDPLSQIRINTTLSTDPVNAGALNIFWE